MSKKNTKATRKNSKKNQKIIASIISVITLIVLTFLGTSTDTQNKLAQLMGIDFAKNNIENIINTNHKTETQANISGNLISSDLTVYFIDVGQADSILVMNQEETMLIDAGNNEDGQDVVNFIKEKGITKLNYVIRNAST